MKNAAPLASLDSAAIFEEEIERIRSKYESGGRLFDLRQDGVCLAAMSMHSRELARLLCRAVNRGEYRFRIAEERLAHIGGKLRPLYRMCLTDTIVASAVARILAALLQGSLSPSCYSYQRGRSSWQAIADFASYLREHRRGLPNPRERGLYVIQRDIAAYGESIPVSDDSPLWPMLDEILIDRANVPREHHFLGLLRELIRPVILLRDGRQTRLEVGVPTGSPIQPVINNLYLSPVDHGLATIEAGFYARYGDDFVFAHPLAEVALEAEALINKKIALLRLKLKASKRQNMYFTAPGRPSFAWPEARPTSRVEHLGCWIDFRGTIGLKRDKVRRLLRDLRRRVRATHRLVEGPGEVPTGVACAVIEKMLDPKDLLAHPLSSLLRHVTNDRKQLVQLDYRVALMVAETFTGRRGPKAFRRISYRKLRRRHGLPSLVHLRNLGRRANRPGVK